ncbi:permease [Sulfurimonas hongkongensis]|uniref:Permease n=1 Tax=Sulfurimonas hongkongensis TaxID=1172190 RepID=T0JQQ9_9BACT|nr:SO_0444 family Cu/Zn efflux transporter [Sulfurimonas hongkongensis]EQB39142.1 permease [Sulfurimonas hongkongensis]
MELIIEFFSALYNLSNAMALYIIFGLAIAGIMHELVPETLVTKHLGSESIGSVIKSTIFGIPLPVCSCGVIPLASSIKKSGASKGATLSFLISTPITGVDSILATYGMFGWIFTLYRVITSMIIAMLAGILTNIFDKEIINEKVVEEKKDSCCSSSNCSNESEVKQKFSFKKAIEYAFVNLLSDIAKPLLWGLIIGAIITISIPENLSAILIEYSWLSYIITIAIAVPMYVCATASLPIAAALMLSGVSAGAAFVFLSAGPATNTVTIGVVKKMLGTKSLYIYLGTIIFGSVIFGLGLDFVFDINSIDTKSLVHVHEEVSLLEILSSIVLWTLMLYFIFKPYFKKA